VAGLASALFLGGWTIPGLSAAQQDGRFALEAAGALWLIAKAGGVAVGLAVLRQAQPARSLAEGVRGTATCGLPLALVVLGLTVGWTRWSGEGTAQALVSGCLVAAAAVAAVAVVHRLRHGVLAPGADGLSPFL
jgi:NADH-quinone oxidoreductase subunit H